MAKIPYIRGVRAGIPTPEELRARIPGRGVDLDRADRPAEPRELVDGAPTASCGTTPTSRRRPAIVSARSSTPS